MQKLVLVLVSALLFNLANAQESFHKHALVFSFGIGGEGYNLTETYSFNGFSGLSKTISGNAGSISYPVSIEYGLNKWIGIGLEGKADNYILGKDSNGFKPSASSFEIGVLVNLHIIRTQHVDFFLGADFGGSDFTYIMDENNDKVSGGGVWGDVHATLRYYLGRLGFFGSVGFVPNANYSLSGNNPGLSLGQEILNTWKSQGEAFSIGLQYRFLSAPTE